MDVIGDDLGRLMDLLVQRPNANELLKALETDILAKYRISNARIFSLDSHNFSKEIYSNSPLADSKNNIDFESLLGTLSSNSDVNSLMHSKIGKSSHNDFLVIPISNGKSLKGFILLDLACSALSPNDLSMIEVIGKVFAYYIMNELPELKHSFSVNNLVGEVKFSARQIQIIQGFVEGKTNHELAADLGFSVSTIRHQTMEIFRVLGASDRKEAAKIAQEKSIV